jgi:segregation and condensation protein A
MAYLIELESFTGPLDLLLHLIQKQELNIHDIPIALITEQYLDYLRTMEELSLEVASEFVVMAATLLYIKSRMLLPRPPRENSEELEVSEDPRQELVEQLIEYQRLKRAAAALKARWETQQLVAYRPPMDLRPYASDEVPLPAGLSIWNLVDAYRRLVRRLPDRQPVAEIPDGGLSVEEAIGWVRDRLSRWRRCRFDDLAAACRTKNEFVAVFVAVLELIKSGSIWVQQAGPFEAIHIEWREEDPSCSSP